MPGEGNGNPEFLPGVSHGERDLASFSPQGLKESGTSEVTAHTHTPHCIYKGPQAKRFNAKPVITVS